MNGYFGERNIVCYYNTIPNVNKHIPPYILYTNNHIRFIDAFIKSRCDFSLFGEILNATNAKGWYLQRMCRR